MSTALDKPTAQHDKVADTHKGGDDPFGMKFFTETTMTDFNNAFVKAGLGNSAKVFDTKLDGGKEMNFKATDATMAAYFKKGEGDGKSPGTEVADAKLKERAKLPWEVDQQQAA